MSETPYRISIKRKGRTMIAKVYAMKKETTHGIAYAMFAVADGWVIDLTAAESAEIARKLNG